MSIYVDNFDAVRPLLEFDDDDHYYFIEIVLRRKDFPEGERVKDHITLNSYFVTSAEMFDKLEPEIKALCHTRNARAYINLDRKPLKKTALLLMQACLDMVENDDYHKLFSRMDSAAGKCPGDKSHKLFIVDLDIRNEESREEATKMAMDALTSCSVKVDVKVLLPTPNGVHIVTAPFDQRAALWRSVALYGAEIFEIKHNSPTVLYYGGSDED